jgi:hypothetical protein
MKKIVAFVFVLAVIAGCNKEKIYKENLNGTWKVYKYLLRNVDKTSLFNAQFPNYYITFTDAGQYTEFYINPDSTFVTGTYSFDDNDEKIILENTYLDPIDSVNKTIKRKYTIFNLTRDHVQLRNDTSQLYMDTVLL